jgi:hypothetical protein
MTRKTASSQREVQGCTDCSQKGESRVPTNNVTATVQSVGKWRSYAWAAQLLSSVANVPLGDVNALRSGTISAHKSLLPTLPFVALLDEAAAFHDGNTVCRFARWRADEQSR